MNLKIGWAKKLDLVDDLSHVKRSWNKLRVIQLAILHLNFRLRHAEGSTRGFEAIANNLLTDQMWLESLLPTAISLIPRQTQSASSSA